MNALSSIRLAYHRGTERTDIFDQQLLSVDTGCHVTLLEHAGLTDPMKIGGRTVLEPGAPIIWFTFEGAWHDIGRFHTADGEFTGYYANAITPVTFHNAESWECTDLYLDLWLGPDGTPTVLDEDEFDAALGRGSIDVHMAQRARIEIEQVLAAASAGAWPPAIAREWTIERVRANNS